MLTPADPLDAEALDEALRPGRRRHFRHLLEVDWDRDGQFAHPLSDLSRAVSARGGVVLRRELADNTPGSQVVASGASAAQLTATLDGHLLVGGEPVPVVDLLAPYNQDSPLFKTRLEGTPVRWSVLTRTRRGWVATRRFTGYLDERRVSRADGTVRLTALDAVAKLSAPARWPLWAVDGPAAARLRDYAPQRGLASAMVDYLCNQAGLYTRPRPPWDTHEDVLALAWLPLTGSFQPAAGRMYSIAPWGNFQMFPEVYPVSPEIFPDGNYWTEGPFGLARDVDPLRYPGSFIYTPRDTMPVWEGRSTSITAWVYCGPDAPGTPAVSSTLLTPAVQVHMGWTLTSSYYANRLSLATDGKSVQIQVEPGTDRIYRVTHTPDTTAWRHVHVQLDHSSGPVRAKMFVDGEEVADFEPTGTGNSETATPLLVLWFPAVGVRLSPTARMCDVMAWQETGAPTVVPERTVQVGAVIDRSLNEITNLPPPSPNDTAWDVIKAISAAEFAAVFVDEDGILHWRNRHTVRSAADPTDITLSAAADVGTVDTAVGMANTVRVSSRAGEATWQMAWALDTVDRIVVTPGTTTIIVPTDDDVIVPETGTVPALYQSSESEDGAPVWSSKVASGWVMVYDGTEVEELDNQTLVNTSDQTGLGDAPLLRIVITHTGTGTGRFRLKQDPTSGTDPVPALRIAGLVLRRAAPTDTEVRWGAAVTADGAVRAIDLGSGDWRQHPDSQRATANWLLRRTTQPIPTFDTITTPGDPRRQLTDRYTLLLGDTGQRVKAYLVGLVQSLDGEGLRDDITVRATHAPGRWALGDEVLGRLGSTAVLG